METTIEQPLINQKTVELCQTLLDQPNIQAVREAIDAFTADEAARGLYEGLMAKGQALQQKQQAGAPLSDEEVADFEKHRETLLKNPVARAFLDAQEELQHVQESIQKYVSKTLELGRVPSEEEMNEDGSCGHGCGCKH